MRRAGPGQGAEVGEPGGSRDWQAFGFGASAVGLFSIVAFSLQFDGRQILSVLAAGIAVAGASWLGGAMLGFLFAIPRATGGDVNTPDGSAGGLRTSFRVNTNLEQISDWLTKIIVGVGLIQIGRAPGALGDLADALGPSFGGANSSSVFGLTIVIFFSVAGFLVSYLWVQLNYRGELHRAEREMSRENLESEEPVPERVRPEVKPVTVSERVGPDVKPVTSVESEVAIVDRSRPHLQTLERTDDPSHESPPPNPSGPTQRIDRDRPTSPAEFSTTAAGDGVNYGGDTPEPELDHDHDD